ncbi:MAG: hypothetical protein QG579_428 [Patescibacteria group bacterium]|nr:hypothetical protein [Patescibacteria group bacterium]
MITITRGFNPTEFVGDGWSIIYEETDHRSIALTELDLSKVELVTMLKGNETYITGEENLSRLKASGKIRLDLDIFLTLWRNQSLIPESWKRKRMIFFDGMVLWRPNGERCILGLHWSYGLWCWGFHRLDCDDHRDARYQVSAVL